MLSNSDVFSYKNGSLYCEQVALAAIADKAGTPCYVYSSAAVLDRFRAYDESLKGVSHLVSYAVKANSNLSLLALLARAGAGFDIVSGGELYRVIQAGGDPGRAVYSGVGKTAAEIEYALKAGILSFNCESDGEIDLIDSLAVRCGTTARIALRVNPDVNAQTHPYISTGLRKHKFGIDWDSAETVYRKAQEFANVVVDGVSCHIGSQLLDFDPLLEALDRLIELVERLRGSGLAIKRLDLGGGLGVRYTPAQETPRIADFVASVRERMKGYNLMLVLEPGRSIVAEAGVLLTRVLYRKKTPEREFMIVDAAMNDLLRPSLYQSHHEIIPLREHHSKGVIADVVGPVCESGDFLARERDMPNALPGDTLAVWTAGAYGFTLASNYNSRVRPPEVLVDGASWRIVRTRETYEDLVRGETT
jgi:diaminopimelate decarboxylase